MLPRGCAAEPRRDGLQDGAGAGPVKGSGQPWGDHKASPVRPTEWQYDKGDVEEKDENKQ